jgi:hypothetical protein
MDHPARPPRQTWWLPIAEIEHGSETINAFKQR